MKEEFKYPSSYYEHYLKGEKWSVACKKKSLYYKWLIKPLGLHNKPLTALEIGSGIGFFTKYLSQYERLTLVSGDFSNDAVSIARGELFKNKNCHNLCFDAKSLPFPDERFDLVFLLDVYEHISNYDLLIEEISRVLKFGGKVVLSTPNKQSLGRFLKLKRPKRLRLRWFGRTDDTHVNIQNNVLISSNFLKSGLQLKKEYTDFLWDPPYLFFMPRCLDFCLFKIINRIYLILGIRLKNIGENIIMIFEKKA